VGLKY